MAGTAGAHEIRVYVDAAPNAYGSPDWDSWLASAYQTAAAGNFVNMANSSNPANSGTTNFEIYDEVVYSFGDLGNRLHWVYYIPEATIEDLDGRFEISLLNTWNGDELDLYDWYYDSTWLQPTSWEEYEGGVIGTAGWAWWGAYEENTQEALDADIAAWITADESYEFTARIWGDDEVLQETTLISNRAAIVPEPTTMTLFGLGLAGFAVKRIRRKRS